MKQQIGFREFSLMMALLMSIVAFSIDAVLPGLGQISQDFSLSNANQAQWVIIAIFAGMTIGELIAGPMSDAIGRKRILFTGIGVYIIGTLMCYYAQSFEWFILGRFVQGLGVAGPHIASVATVRDKYSGAHMARIMSLIMMVFMVVPAIAPSVGQVVIHFFSWRDIFILYLFYAVLISIWVAIRLEESLIVEKRVPMRLGTFKDGFKQVIQHKTTRSYLLCVGLCYGAFVAYLGTSQQVFMQQFGKSGAEFSAYFALLAVFMGASSFLNSKMVLRFGMRKISQVGMFVVSVMSLLFVVLQIAGVQVGFNGFMLYAVILFFTLGAIFSNLNSIAMEPMGHIAGMASALINAVSSVLSLILAAIIGQLYDGTLVPLTGGFALLFGLAFLLTIYEKRHAVA